MTAPRIRAIAIVLAWLLVPSLAAACPMCVPKSETSRMAFFWTAVVMSLLPLSLVGGTIYWLWTRSDEEL